MIKPLIKICGLMDAETACQASQMGVDFIGIIFHPASRRYVTINQAKKIVAAIKSGNAQPVAVFVNHSARQMAEITSATGIQYIQLHGPRARRQHYLLPEKYSRIYVQTVSPDGVINDECVQQGNISRDFLLFDTLNPGHGQTFNWDTFQYSGHYRHGLAGGLTPKNVETAIKKIQPVLVDVSSGVENSAGDKDLDLIQQFINAVRGSTRNSHYAE